MPHRVHKRKKVVEVNGDVDLSTIWRKVEAHGGPEGWTLRTFITRDDIQQIASMIALGRMRTMLEKEVSCRIARSGSAFLRSLE